MGHWTIFGTKVSFSVDEQRTCASGLAEQECAPDLHHVDMSAFAKKRAAWQMVKGKESNREFRQISENWTLLYADKFGASRAGEVAKLAEQAACIIEDGKRAVTSIYCDGSESTPAFGFYVPERQFDAIFDLLKPIAAGAPMRYVFHIEFPGFMPMAVPVNAEHVSQEEWAAGRNFHAVGLKFSITPIGPD
jgi:hypothetical protein